MPPLDQATTGALLGVIGTLQKELEAQREEAAKQRDEMAKQLEAALAEAAEARQEIARLVAMVEGLTRQLDELLRDRDQEQRAELAKLREQAKAALEAAGTEPGDGPAAAPPAPPKSPPRRDAHGRKPIPKEIPRETTRLQPAVCPKCEGTRLDVEKTLVSEEWHFVRAHLRAKKTERVICTCRDCDERIVPEQPPMPFDRVACTFAMMAWLCYAKAGLFLPLDRLQRDFEDQGAHLASSTLTRWWQRGADLLMPVAESVRMSLLSGTHIRTDGTGLLVVFPRVKGAPVKGEHRPGETDDEGYLLPRLPNNGQIIVFGDDDHAVFHYTPTKEGHHALDFLTLGKDTDGDPIRWKGTITADALSAHDCLFTDGERIEAGCNAHGLRKFRDDKDKAPLLASRAMAFIGRLYDEDTLAKKEGLLGAELLARRQLRSAPIATEFRAWIDEHLHDLLPSNPVRKAMQYYINHWGALTRFLQDPAVELDNNWSERALKSIALIRNNSLYAGGEDGAVRLCTLLTLIVTARLVGLDPFAYLEWALTRAVSHRHNRGLVPSDLTPEAYKASEQADTG